MAFSLSLDELGIAWRSFNANYANWANFAKSQEKIRAPRSFRGVRVKSLPILRKPYSVKPMDLTAVLNGLILMFRTGGTR